MPDGPRVLASEVDGDGLGGDVDGDDLPGVDATQGGLLPGDHDDAGGPGPDPSAAVSTSPPGGVRSGHRGTDRTKGVQTLATARHGYGARPGDQGLEQQMLAGCQRVRTAIFLNRLAGSSIG